ncbi:MAG: ABC transporter permease [Phycisphaerales bacterium]
MMTQTWAIFVDAYRELNSKKLFWITMVLSGLVVALFACVGIDERSPTFLWFHIDFLPIDSTMFSPALLYKLLFLNLGLGVWLTWIATILALISTAPIFPDLIAGGAIETVLSKPISRTRLFLTKYAAGLLFVGLQVGVFTGASFLVIGIRGGAWEPGLFLAVPIVVVFFSYLFAVCAVLGLMTRSTIASLLLTILFWFFLYLLNMADAIFVSFREQTEAEIAMRTAQIERAERGTSRMLVRQREAEQRAENGGEQPGGSLPDGASPGEPAGEGTLAAWTPTAEEIDAANPFIAQMRRDNEQSRDGLAQLEWWSGLMFAIKTPLPKTGETISLLSRTLIDMAELEAAEAAASEEDGGSGRDAPPLMPGQEPPELDREAIAEAGGRGTRDEFQSRSVWWVMGTSLAFEAAVLGFGAWRFSRRDF